MKKVIIPFSLTEYQKGGYEVETRGDVHTPPRKARIICTDHKDEEHPLIALVDYGYVEDTRFYTEHGYFHEDEKSEFDLRLVKQEFEDGDIVIREDNSLGGFILPYRGTNKSGGILTEVYLDYIAGRLHTPNAIERGCGFTREYCLATEDEKQIFFDALAKIGKQWNAENKCIEDIKSKFYFKPKDWCLMSCGGYNEWVLCQFSNIKDLGYIAVGGKYFTQCIPYNDKTKHLLGTIYDATEKYKVW